MNIEQVEKDLREARPYFYRYPQPVKVYLHWTGGHRYTSFDDYHFCIDSDGEIIESLPLTEIPSATYRRNTGSIAISICGCYGAKAYDDGNGDYHADLGDEAPTDNQIEALAMLVAKISEVFDIPIDLEHVMTHAEAADNMDGVYMHEPYGPSATFERWDLAVISEDDDWMSGGDTIRGKAQWYKENGV